MSRRSREGFNAPFAELKRRLAEQRKRESSRSSKEAEAARSRARAAEEEPDEPPGPAADEVDDAELFHRWLEDVEPLPKKGRQRVVTAKRTEPPAGTTAPDEDAEVIAALSDLVAGEGDFDISDTDEYVEGIAPGIDRRILRRLRRGDFSVQAHLDLHGMVRAEARAAVERFLRSSRFAGKRCVIVVHGRGLRSPGGEPVLKKALVRWLSRGALAKQVLAFTSTLSYDGGGGAMYVLLRR